MKATEEDVQTVEALVDIVSEMSPQTEAKLRARYGDKLIDTMKKNAKEHLEERHLKETFHI